MFDALTMRAIADELKATISGGRVQRVGLADERTLILEIFARGVRQHLLVSDHPQMARVHLVPARLTADAERVTPFLLLLRKHVRGGRIVTVAQPSLERTLVVSIVKAYPLVKDNTPVEVHTDHMPDQMDDMVTDEPDALPPGWVFDETTLVIEIMGRHSNVILVDADGEILDALKRVPPATSRVRPILPHLAYTPPPPQEKADPRAMTPAQIHHLCLLATERTSLPNALVGSLRGISPQIAREIAFRATGGTAPPATATDADRIAAALHDVLAPLATGAWQPRLYL